jgi:uncharacterized iron-regulated membrane protein
MAQVWERPRQLKGRRVVFLIHLWIGLALTLWVILIGLSGSALVFEDDLSRMLLPTATLPPTSLQVPMAVAVQSALRMLPRATPYYVATPDSSIPFFRIWMRAGTHGREQVLTADARSGTIIPSQHSPAMRVLAALHDFHVDLLLVPTGLQVNAILSAFLLIGLCSGMFLWWPGIRLWQRGLSVNRRHGWKRVNFDLHHAVGFWTLLWCLCWAVSGFYFGFPSVSQRVIGSMFAIRAMKPPLLDADIGVAEKPTLAAVLLKAQQQSPRAFLSGVSLPVSAESPYIVTLDTRMPGDFSHRDIVQVSARSGRLLSVWHYGQNQTPADTVLWGLYGLHFGTLWGMAWKVIWALLGLSLPLLAVTGCLMYWNRFLRRLVF